MGRVLVERTHMRQCDIEQEPESGNANIQGSGGQQDRMEWVGANFTQIFGTSAKDLQAQGINPRQYREGTPRQDPPVCADAA